MGFSKRENLSSGVCEQQRRSLISTFVIRPLMNRRLKIKFIYKILIYIQNYDHRLSTTMKVLQIYFNQIFN